MKRKSLANELCPIARSLDVIGEWWSLLIIRDAMLGKRRFSDFQKSLGVRPCDADSLGAGSSAQRF